MKYLGFILYAFFSLLLLIIRFETRMPWRTFMRMSSEIEITEWSNHEKKRYRKKEYVVLFILWMVAIVVPLVWPDIIDFLF